MVSIRAHRSGPAAAIIAAVLLFAIPVALAEGCCGGGSMDSGSGMDMPTGGEPIDGGDEVAVDEEVAGDDLEASTIGDPVQSFQDEQLRRIKVLVGVVAVIGAIAAIWLWGPALAAAAGSAWATLGTASTAPATWSVAQRAAAVELIKQLNLWVSSNVK